MTRRKVTLLVLVVGLAVVIAVAIQTGAIRALIEKIQGVFAGSHSSPTTEMSAPGAVNNPTEEAVGGFVEIGGQPQLPTGSGPANIAETPPDEGATQGKGSTKPSK